jgi:parallel beta-helix repeat protein
VTSLTARPLRSLVASGVVVLLSLLALGGVANAATASSKKTTLATAPSGASTSPESPEELNLCGVDRGLATYHGTNAERDLHRAIPDPLKVVNFPCTFPVKIRGIRLDAHSVSLVAGGTFVRSVALPTSGPVTLPLLAQLINDPTWLAETSPGVFELKASLVQEAGTTLDVEAPGVSLLRMDINQAVTIGGSGATANFDGVVVESWDPQKDEPVTSPTFGRPFVLYENASQLNILHSTMEYLGSDETSSYGVSWRVGGTSGVVDDSLFQHNFFGVYTYEAAHVTFENSTFRYNTFYGIDPHTYSTNLTITKNNVYGNSDHGIVFSRYVTNSVVSGNYVHDNKVNGIMMDFHSDGNVISHNVVTGNAQGIVMSGSAQDNVFDNTIANNVVGIRASHDGADLDNIHNNAITGGKIGIQLYAGATATQVIDNSIKGPSSTGLVLDSPRSVVSANTISSTPTGMKLLTVATLIGGTVRAQKVGVEVGPEGFASVRSVVVDATRPLSHAAGSIVQLTGTTFHLPSTGSSVSGLDIAGLLVLLFAFLCELLHLARGRSIKRFALGFGGHSPVGTLVERPVSRLSRLSVQFHPSLECRPAAATTVEAKDPARRFRRDLHGLPTTRRSHLIPQLPRRAVATGVALISTFLIGAVLLDLTSGHTSTPSRPFTTPELSAAISSAGDAASLASVTAALNRADHLTSIPSNVTPPLNADPTDFPAATQDCEVTEATSLPNLPCNQFGDPKGDTQVVLVGDSHAGMWLPAVNEVAVQNHWRLTFLAKNGCSIGDYPNLVDTGYAIRTFTECDTWRQAVIADIISIHPAVVIVASEAQSIAATEPTGLTESLDRLAKSSAKLIFLADTPTPLVDVPDCLAQHPDNVAACNIPYQSAGIQSAGRLAEIAGAKAAGAAVIDPTPWFCTGTICPVIVQNTIVYMDASHVTGDYALLREPQLATAINSAVARS